MVRGSSTHRKPGSICSRLSTSSRTQTQASSPLPDEIRARIGRAKRNTEIHRPVSQSQLQEAGDACLSSSWSRKDATQSQAARAPCLRDQRTCEVGSAQAFEAEQLAKLNQLTTVAEVRQFIDDAKKRLNARIARNKVRRKGLRKVSSRSRRFEAEQLAKLNQLTSHAEIRQFIDDAKTRMEARMSRNRAMRKGIRELYALLCDD